MDREEPTPSYAGAGSPGTLSTTPTKSTSSTGGGGAGLEWAIGKCDPILVVDDPGCRGDAGPESDAAVFFNDADRREIVDGGGEQNAVATKIAGDAQHEGEQVAGVPFAALAGADFVADVSVHGEQGGGEAVAEAAAADEAWTESQPVPAHRDVIGRQVDTVGLIGDLDEEVIEVCGSANKRLLTDCCKLCSHCNKFVAPRRSEGDEAQFVVRPIPKGYGWDKAEWVDRVE